MNCDECGNLAVSERGSRSLCSACTLVWDHDAAPDRPFTRYDFPTEARMQAPPGAGSAWATNTKVNQQQRRDPPRRRSHSWPMN